MVESKSDFLGVLEGIESIFRVTLVRFKSGLIRDYFVTKLEIIFLSDLSAQVNSMTIFTVGD